jgi:hypothetical protein
MSVQKTEVMEEQFRDLQKLTSLEQPVVADDLGPISFIPNTQIWERHPDESPKEWIMFSVYLELDPTERSLAKAYKEYLASMGKTSKTAEAGRPIPMYYDISRQNRWVERADAYDRYIDKKVQAELIDQKVLSRVALAKLGAVLRRKAAEAAALIQSMTVTKSGRVRSALTINEIATLSRLAKDLESSALGWGGGSGPGMGLELNLSVNAVQSDDDIVDRASLILKQRGQLIDVELTGRGEKGTTSPTG